MSIYEPVDDPQMPDIRLPSREALKVINYHLKVKKDVVGRPEGLVRKQFPFGRDKDAILNEQEAVQWFMWLMPLAYTDTWDRLNDYHEWLVWAKPFPMVERMEDQEYLWKMYGVCGDIVRERRRRRL